MPFRLSVAFRGEELAATRTETDDPIVAIHHCKAFAKVVSDTLVTEMGHKSMTLDRLERRTLRIDDQLPMFDLAPLTKKFKLSESPNVAKVFHRQVTHV